jgi:spoIIIJ-associated protein
MFSKKSELDPKTVLEAFLSQMGFEVIVEGEEEDEERVLITLGGTDASLLIGKKGETLDALQYLLNKMIGRDLADRKPIVLDSGGYRQRRNDALVQLAQRLSEQALSTKKIIAVNPMSAHDRRIIHMALRDTPGVSTCSEGEGIYRRLLIIPDP